MRKEIEINGCVEIPCEITTDEFADAFIEWIESKGWHFGGGFNEIVDGYYIIPYLPIIFFVTNHVIVKAFLPNRKPSLF